MEAALIVQQNNRWYLAIKGSFLMCKAQQKRIKAAFVKTKVIYEFNLNKYL